MAVRIQRPRVLWTSYQREHIELRHHVTKSGFLAAWRYRTDLGEYHHRNGVYLVSVGFAEDRRMLELVWRWQGGDVWPITAYVPEEDL
jgi:hypothetical protein